MTRNEAHSKLRPAHLSRKAVVYLRQSSLAQVRANRESQRLQYALEDTARGYGFERVEIIDCDLGASAGAGAKSREGFKRLLAEIALGEVGLVLSRELSRLSRTDRDFCHLVELCQVFDTLIGDAENLYEPGRLDDQLILGIKGTLSVVELQTLKSRLQQGREAKAQRGELERCLAPGYVFDATHRIVKDPNLRVQEAIVLVFSKFAELGSIRQVHRWFRESRVELPVNKARGGRFHLQWQLPTHSFVSSVLHNPLYAGAYVYGRRPVEVVVSGEGTVKRQGKALDAEAASVFIPDHHECYITWAEYERHLATMRSNGGNFASDEAVLAVREGHGLLVGLLRCGRCGRKLHARYWGKQGTAARYLCVGDFDAGGRYCLGFGGATVDRRMSEQLLAVLTPHGVEASLAAMAQLAAEDDDRRAALERQLQQLRYEAERAFAQYDEADPRNRLVAEVLEQRWNDKLKDQRQIEKALEDARATRAPLTPATTETIRALGRDFAAVWDDPACPKALKKRIARTLIHEIIVDLDDSTQELHFVVHWEGGSHSSWHIPKPQSGAVAHKTALEDVELIQRMAVRYGDDEIARVLSKLGRRTGKGNRFNQARVASVRRKHGIRAPDHDALDPDILTLAQAVRHTGASDTTLMRLVKAKILAANQVAPYAPLEIRRSDLDSEPVAAILAHLQATGKLVFKGDTSTQQESLFHEDQ